MRDVVERVEIFDPLDHEGRELTGEELHWRYRRLELPAQTLVLSATFVLSVDEPAAIRERMRAYLDRRLATQPVNEPSCGSVFKNPEGDQAGRLIDAAGLKELRVGGAEISGLHANFIVNRGGATASDVLALIARATEEVETRFGVRLETEVRMLGEVGEA
jgi:UDP-N-acetylmuramate dehydrogenase